MSTEPMGIDEVLNRALEKETEARDFYAGLADRTSVEFVRDLLTTLQNEESKHIRMIEDMLGRLETGKRLT